ncbi:MAG TPA: PilZ domain-containing protein [Terracidiphilus sp.]|jgi:hypothetical protein|nr:PilZ domain-containing protein [Terracidiphilus sp.]
MSKSEQNWNKPAGDGGRIENSRNEPLFKRILRKIFPDQRKHERIEVPPVVGYLGTMHGSRPFEVGDVSLGGFSLKTDERWEPGTEMPVTLQRSNGSSDHQEERFTVQATVVRWADGGVGFSVLLSEEQSVAAHGNPLQVRWASQDEMRMFLARLKNLDEAIPAEGDRTASDRGDSLRAAFGHARPMYTQSAGD